jgi:hypothetical protein
LRAPEQVRRDGRGAGTALGGCRSVIKRRCSSCHTQASGKPLPLVIERGDTRGLTRPLGPHERRVIKDDPLAYYGAEILINFTNPERSPVLLAPLSGPAGGWGRCGLVFTDRKDPDYQHMLARIREGKRIMDAGPRYTETGFKPNRQYVREMKKYGVLPESFDRGAHEIDVFETDRKYWRSLWYE